MYLNNQQEMDIILLTQRCNWPPAQNFLHHGSNIRQMRFVCESRHAMTSYNRIDFCLGPFHDTRIKYHSKHEYGKRSRGLVIN